MKRVALFEDEAMIRDIIGSILRDEGFEVAAYASPVLAGPEEQPDIVVSDNRMPSLTGLEYARRLRQSGQANRPIALMSGDWSAQDACEAETLGCKVFHKPFPLSALREWLTTLA